MAEGLARIREAQQAVDVAEQTLLDARRALWRAIAEEHQRGLSLSAIGRELGVSRQRVAQLVLRGE